MKYYGTYFISNPTTNLEAALNTVNTLVQGIETSSQNATRQNPWSLQYRVFRDTIPPGHTPPVDAEGKPKPFAHTLQHLIHMSSLDHDRTYICIQPPTGVSTVSGIPLRQQEAHALLVRHQFAALWQPRHVLSLQQGTSYSTGLCTVQLGELRSTREGPQSSGILSPGIVVCISTVIETSSEETTEMKNGLQENGASDVADDAADFEYAQAIIRDCWNKIKANRDLGKSEVREFMMAQEKVTGVREKEAAIRMWSEVLRLRG